MKITREIIRGIQRGGTLMVECSPSEAFSARTTVAHVRLLDSERYRVSYDKTKGQLAITHLKDEGQLADAQ